jgi:rod shape-determining protein MreC
MAANILGFSQGVREYFSLRTINEELAQENANLRTDLERLHQLEQNYLPVNQDSIKVDLYDFVSAKVIANSTNLYKNFITINKGAADGILPGMAAISNDGAVGKVKSVSENYSVLISLLNVDEQISCVIKRTNHFGSARWDGLHQRYSNLLFIPRHATPVVGDTVITSGYNAVFPEGIMVGIIRKANLQEETNFWDIQIELTQDFGRLSFVEVIKSRLKNEKDSLEQITIGIVK